MGHQPGLNARFVLNRYRSCEAWLRLGGDTDRTFQNRTHFFNAAGEAMRRIPIDRARRRHGGGHTGEHRRVKSLWCRIAMSACWLSMRRRICWTLRIRWRRRWSSSASLSAPPGSSRGAASVRTDCRAYWASSKAWLPAVGSRGNLANLHGCSSGKPGSGQTKQQKNQCESQVQ